MPYFRISVADGTAFVPSAVKANLRLKAGKSRSADSGQLNSECPLCLSSFLPPSVGRGSCDQAGRSGTAQAGN